MGTIRPHGACRGLSYSFLRNISRRAIFKQSLNYEKTTILSDSAVRILCDSPCIRLIFNEENSMGASNLFARFLRLSEDIILLLRWKSDIVELRKVLI